MSPSNRGIGTGRHYKLRCGGRFGAAGAAAWLCLLAWVFLFVGCGGGGKTAFKSTAGTGRATFTIAWPTSRAGKQGRAIPANAQSIRIRLTYLNVEVGNQLVKRPDSKATLTDLPPESLTGSAVAYAAPDGTGPALASAAFTLKITQNSDNPIEVSLESAVSTLLLSPAAPVSLISNQTQQIAAITQDAAGNAVPVPAANLTWTSDNPTVATVVENADGTATVTGLQAGTANITVTESDSKLTSKPTQIIVTAGLVASIGLDPVGSVALTPGQTQKFNTIIKDKSGNTITVAPSALTWTSDNTAAATVDANGTVTGLKPGTTRITVTEKDSGRSATGTVIVGAGAIAKLVITPDPSGMALIHGQSAAPLAAMATDKDNNTVALTPANLTWATSDAGVATVAVNADGTAIVTGQSRGTAKITVTEANSKQSASVNVTVRVDVEVSPTPLVNGNAVVTLSGTQQYTAAVTGASDTSVKWTVQEGQAGGSITLSGLYTAPNKPGTYHIVATSNADTAQTGTATVNVVAGTGTVIVQ